MRAVIYVRQSLDRAGEGVAVERQLAKCRELANARDLEVIDTITENDTSASKGSRPGFESMIERLEREEFSVIVVWHTDRLYRQVKDLVRLMDMAEKHPLHIMTVSGGDLDLSNPTGRMFATMTAGVARYEIEHKSERQIDANRKRALLGVRHVSARPYGYEKSDAEWKIVDSEAAVLRETVNRYIAGETFYSIAKDLKARGVVGMNGKPFSYQNLTLRATNPALAGVRLYKGETANEEGQWPPIIDKATWERFSTALAARRHTQDWSKSLKFVGSGLYRCGVCDAPVMVTRDFKSGNPVYQCHDYHVRRRLAAVDELVEAAVVARLSAADAAALLTPTVDEAALASEAQELRARLDGLAELFADGLLSKVAVQEQSSRLRERLATIRAKLDSSNPALNAVIQSADISGFWRDSMTLMNKRRIIDALFTVRIMPTKRGGRNEFRPEDVVIEFR
ncbi:recombinase family protein [Microcella alkalica]|uniref:recombinase family protein n=1 Tax=Microcella alkalica TaxID=355930 RepID=UPI00145C4FC8|nr:recombinase family protein [Microcella alkalica]